MSKKVKISDLIHDNKNFNKGSEFGNSLIEKSLRKYGAGLFLLIKIIRLLPEINQ